MKKKIVTFILLIFAAVIIAIGSFYLGRSTANTSGITFYAQIEHIGVNSMGNNYYDVKGLDVNDINYRGYFSFSTGRDTTIIWLNTKVQESELDVGDTIAITFTGDVMESDPIEINGITRITLLSNEK